MIIIHIYHKSKNKKDKSFIALDILGYTNVCYAYSHKKEKYMKFDDIDDGAVSNTCNCTSIEEAISIIKRSDVPKETTFVLINKSFCETVTIIS